MTGFSVNVEVLRSAAHGMEQTMRDAESFRIEDLSGDEPQYGHERVHEGFEHFCDRWQEGIEILLEDASAIVQALKDVASAYQAAEQDTSDVIESGGLTRGNDR